jgi:hypothetical protein
VARNDARWYRSLTSLCAWLGRSLHANLMEAGVAYALAYLALVGHSEAGAGACPNLLPTLSTSPLDVGPKRMGLPCFQYSPVGPRAQSRARETGAAGPARQCALGLRFLLPTSTLRTWLFIEAFLCDEVRSHVAPTVHARRNVHTA